MQRRDEGAVVHGCVAQRGGQDVPETVRCACGGYVVHVHIVEGLDEAVGQLALFGFGGACGGQHFWRRMVPNVGERRW